MAGEFVPSGVELAAKGLGQFLSDLKTANNAIAQVGSGVGVSVTPFTNLGNSILDIGAKAAQVAAGGIAALGAAITAVAIKGTADFINLEQGLADIHAISGDTAEVVAPLKDLISELALDPNLKVTTDEATQALYALTKQGLEVSEIMDGAGRSTVELANATGSNFNVAGTVAAGVMKNWKLEAQDLGLVVDGITGVLTNSKFTIDDYNLAMTQGGGVAAAYGVSLQDFNTIIAGTSTIFGSGSDAGTSFKTMLLHMAAPTNEAKAVMDQYGISLFDSNGQMRDMREVAAQLNQVMEGSVTITSTVGGVTQEVADAAKNAAESMPDLTQTIQEQATRLDILKGEYGVILQHYDANSTKARTAALAIDSLTYDYNKNIQKLGEYEMAIGAATGANERQITTTKKLTEEEKARLTEAIGGADAARMLVALGQMSAEEYDNLSAKVNANGQAMNAAAIRMDTTSGALEILQGVLEAVQLQIGEKFTPMVKRAAQAMAAWVSDNSGPVIAFFGNIATGIENTVASLTKIGGAFSRFGVRGAAISLLGQLGFDRESIATVTSTIDTITSEIDRIKLVFQQFGVSGVAFSIGGLLGLDSDSMIGIQATITGIIESITAFAEQVKTTLSGMGFEELKGALLGVGAVLAGSVFAAIVAGLLTLLTPINLIIAGAALLGAAWAGNWGGIQEITASVITYVTEQVSSLQEALTPAFNSIWESLTRLGEAFGAAGVTGDSMSQTLGAIGTFIIETVIPGFIEFAGILADTVAMSISGIVDWMIKGHDAFLVVSDFVTNSLVPALVQLGDIINTSLNIALQYMADLWINSIQPALLNINAAITPVSKLLEEMGNFSIAVTNKALEGLGISLENARQIFETVGNFLADTFGPAIEDIAGWLGDRLRPVMDKVGTLLRDVLAPGFADTGSIVKDDVMPTVSNFADVVLPILTKGIELVNEAIERTTNLFKGLTDAVSGFSVPDILTPGSPPPLAYALMDVASGATAASDAIGNMQRNLAVNNSARFIDDLDMGGFLDQFGAGRGGIRRNFRNILKNEITAGMAGLVDGTVDIFGKINEVAARFHFPPSMAQEFAQMNGLVEHLTGSMAAFKREIAIENLGNLIQMGQTLNGLGGQFADLLQESMAWGEESVKIIETYRKSLDTLSATESTSQIAIDKKELAIEKANEALAFGERQMNIYRQELEALMQDEIGNALDIEKKILAMDRLTESMDAQGQSLVTLQQELANMTETMTANQQAVEDARRGYETLQAQAFDLFSGSQSGSERIQSELSTIALLQDFLESGESTFLIPADAMSQAAGITGILYDQISGQQELNRLLAEQERREELITQQKEAQQKLDFLKAQLDLIKMGEQLGGDIFAGINFGLDASVEDLLAATNALVNAMVSEIDAGFALGSPSHLMYDKFSDVVAGARMALEDGRSIMGRAMSKMLSPIYNMTDILPGMGSTATTNNNYYMTVNTGASAPAVMQQYNVARSMYAS